MKWLSLTAASFVAGFVLSVALVSSQERAHGPEFQEAGGALMCQCGGCNATVATCSMEHCHSAEPIREEIWERLQRGDSVASIIDTFRERYGLVILSAPPASGIHMTAWVVPFAVLLLGAFVTRQVLRSWRRETEASGPAAVVTPISDAQRARIEKELRDLS